MKKIVVFGLMAVILLVLAGCKMGIGEDWAHCPKCGQNARLVYSGKDYYEYQCTNLFCGISFNVQKGSGDGSGSAYGY